MKRLLKSRVSKENGVLCLLIAIFSIVFISITDQVNYAGEIYQCKDQTGTIVLVDRPLYKNCRSIESFKDITDQDRQAWENEKAAISQQDKKTQEVEDIAKQKRREAERQEARQDERFGAIRQTIKEIPQPIINVQPPEVINVPSR